MKVIKFKPKAKPKSKNDLYKYKSHASMLKESFELLEKFNVNSAYKPN